MDKVALLLKNMLKTCLPSLPALNKNAIIASDEPLKLPDVSRSEAIKYHLIERDASRAALGQLLLCMFAHSNSQTLNV